MGIPLLENKDVVSPDSTTLFVCSGMQSIKQRFIDSDKSKYGSIQSCIRTNDLELVGDGSHLTYFEMIGNFSFGNNDYEQSIELWLSILSDLGLRRSITSIHYHPDRDDMRHMWTKRGFITIPDEECVWTDGELTGYCTEVYVGSLEIGNLVNTLGHSTDVGFGMERMVQVVEGEPRVDCTSLFETKYHPIVRDHIRTLKVFYENGIVPGGTGREYICRRLLRRILPYINWTEDFIFNDWLEIEQNKRDKCLRLGNRKWKKFKDKDDNFFWETYGMMPEEVEQLRIKYQK